MFTLPQTISQARDVCMELEGLASAGGWKRAAIVWAFTLKHQGHGGKLTTSSEFSIKAFAALGLAGLCSQDTVRKYHNSWQWAIDNGQAQPADPGGTVNIPQAAWPPPAPEAKPKRVGARPSPSEKVRLYRFCADAYQRGYTGVSIGRAVGMHRSQVTQYAKLGGAEMRRGGLVTNWVEPAEPLETYHWRDDEQRLNTVEPLYLRSRTVALLSHTKRECINDNSLNQLAFDVDQALRAGDQTWMDDVLDTVRWLHIYLGKLEAVLVSDQARGDAMTGRDGQREETRGLYLLPHRSA